MYQVLFPYHFPNSYLFKLHWYRWEGPRALSCGIWLPVSLSWRLQWSHYQYCSWRSRVPMNVLTTQVNEKLVFLHWLKIHDHVSEKYWQSLLWYVYARYFSFGHHQTDFKSIPLPEKIDPMYVPSFAVRHNDPEINPPLLRRLVNLQSLKRQQLCTSKTSVIVGRYPCRRILSF